ncbi:hypothetical protein PGT21_028771 [Puccinia graminis f. sp. tritici]|uniref:Uncharacterized protein n=1 Tax=Puccinia graminis f. sp. tritici TaxID=56615 RepID=A0A5B0P963_PUCGR|nr:hypothetical protein PGT21_028771 [Puccinia graminis f. sp. tritici]KAA1116918.1 hypothetical protein PGTUg99_030432 [Puccinia graminis f. sp. tritici]
MNNHPQLDCHHSGSYPELFVSNCFKIRGDIYMGGDSLEIGKPNCLPRTGDGLNNLLLLLAIHLNNHTIQTA